MEAVLAGLGQNGCSAFGCTNHATSKKALLAFITLLSIGLIGRWYFGQEHQTSLKISQVATGQKWHLAGTGFDC